MDGRTLLNGLIEYRDSLERHLARLLADFTEMEQRSMTCMRVYEGGDADEFWAHWRRTTDDFREYQIRTMAILPMLNERIQALERFVDGRRTSGIQASE
jgi:ketosteroid isomerase-like protein